MAAKPKFLTAEACQTLMATSPSALILYAVDLIDGEHWDAFQHVLDTGVLHGAANQIQVPKRASDRVFDQKHNVLFDMAVRLGQRSSTSPEIKACFIDICQRMLKVKAGPVIGACAYDQLFITLCAKGDLKAINIMLDLGRPPVGDTFFAADQNGPFKRALVNCLSAAVTSGNLELCKTLIHRGADLPTPNARDYTDAVQNSKFSDPAFAAVRGNAPELMEYFITLRAEADPGFANSGARQKLLRAYLGAAISMGSDLIGERILSLCPELAAMCADENNVNLMTEFRMAKTLILYAKHASVTAAELGVLITETSDEAWSAETLDRMLPYCDDIHRPNTQSWETLLTLATSRGYLDCAVVLLAHGADPDRPGSNGSESAADCITRLENGGQDRDAIKSLFQAWRARQALSTQAHTYAHPKSPRTSKQ